MGTAPNADSEVFPINTPVLIAGQRTLAAKLGEGGTLPAAMDDIFDQAGAMVVVVRVNEGLNDAETLSNVIGGIDAQTGQYQGIQALLGASSDVHVTPRILIASEFTHHAAVANELLSVAERLRAVVIADGPNTNDLSLIHI